MSREQGLPGRNISNTLDLPDHRAIAEIRLILALATMVAVSFMPSPSAQSMLLPYGVIAAYIASALVLYWVVLNRPALVRRGLVYWVDAGWLLAIVSLSGHPDNPLFLLLLFPILVAAAQSGFVQGMSVLAVTTLAFVLLSGLAAGTHPKPELLLQTGTLLALGFMVSRWAGAESRLKRELSALNRLGKSPGLRDDAEPFWRDTLQELAVYFGAESAFFLGREEDGSYRIYEYETGKPVWSMTLDDEQATLLASVPERWAIAWRSFFRIARLGRARVVDLVEGKTLEGMEGRLRELVQILETRRWLSFPLLSGPYYRGRVFLLGIERFRFKPEWGFIQQLAGQVSLKWDNLLLARQLTRIAASGERERISRDLHDGTVQPYLGLKFGLEALRMKVPDDDALAADVDELVRVTDTAILQLRGYIRDLRTSEVEGTYAALTVIRAQVQQFEDYSGLKVEIHAPEFDLKGSKLLEVRQIIAEGLSNIRRHSSARQAVLDIVVEQNILRIAFINPVANIVPAFTPRSLTERAAAMGGWVEAARLATQTVVRIVLPLWMQEKK